MPLSRELYYADCKPQYRWFQMYMDGVLLESEGETYRIVKHELVTTCFGLKVHLTLRKVLKHVN